jgi:hypothetical protein
MEGSASVLRKTINDARNKYDLPISVFDSRGFVGVKLDDPDQMPSGINATGFAMFPVYCRSVLKQTTPVYNFNNDHIELVNKMWESVGELYQEIQRTETVRREPRLRKLVTVITCPQTAHIELLDEPTLTVLYDHGLLRGTPPPTADEPFRIVIERKYV